MTVDFPTILWTLLNFAILFFLLKKFLFKPVTELMEKRTNDIQNDINSARLKLEEAEKTKNEYAATLSTAAAKREDIIQTAKDAAAKDAEEIIRQARFEADNIISKAKEAIEFEKQNALKDIRNEITSLAFAAASKILQKNVDTEANKKIVQNFLDEEGVA